MIDFKICWYLPIFCMKGTVREQGERRRVLESTRDLLIYAIFSIESTRDLLMYTIFSMESTGEYKRFTDIYHFFMESTFGEHGERRKVLESTRDLLIYTIFSRESTGE